jgi:hypothetical protein
VTGWGCCERRCSSRGRRRSTRQAACPSGRHRAVATSLAAHRPGRRRQRPGQYAGAGSTATARTSTRQEPRAAPAGPHRQAAPHHKSVRQPCESFTDARRRRAVACSVDR